MPNKIGRPKKHESTQQKAMRLPNDMIQELENQRKEGESFTDVLIRFVKQGLVK
jgi:predicted CopG family antitoxin